MKRTVILFTAAILITACTGNHPGYLHSEGNRIVNGQGEEVILRGIGLGGWMLQEPYMLKLARVLPAQHAIRNNITDLIGEEKCLRFYNAWLDNMVTEKDIDSLKAWGFNSVRLPMHYNLFTMPVQQEAMEGENTWLERGFTLTDSLLAWCSKNEIYLILDLHAAPGGQGNDIPIADIDTSLPRLWDSEMAMKKTIELWRKLAERYADEPWIGGYDLLNETNYPLGDNSKLKELMVNITGAIREYDRHHIIFVEGNSFATDFTGLTPPWDKNMAYSFHKYWSPTTTETIQKYLDLRNETGAPLWMGESGENTCEWFSSAVDLFESNDIGWAWWTLKKIEGENSIMNVKMPDGYNDIISYWKGVGAAPDTVTAFNALMGLAENTRIENCVVNHDVIQALFKK